MPDRLVFESDGKPGEKARHEIKVSRLGETGDLVTSYWPCYFDRTSHFRDGAKVLGVPFADLAGMVARYRAAWQPRSEVVLPEEPTAAEPAEEQPAVVFRVRGLRQSATEGRTYADIFEALTAPCDAADPVVEWDGIEEYCILDLDFHKGQTPDANDLRISADTLRPMPVAWWRSRNGGLHCLFLRDTILTAAELASLASLKLAARFPAAAIELKHSTRQPPGEVVRIRPHASGGLSGLPGEPGRVLDAEDAAAWLEERDLLPGQRYPHERCPVNPHPRAEGNAPPVVVFEDHIYCHICAADGVRRGSGTPGYFPLAKLAGTVQQSMLQKCVNNFTHWDHARHIVGQTVEDETRGKLVYRAALKQRHGDDLRVDRVFYFPKTGLVRYEGHWADSAGSVLRLDKASRVLAELPAALRPEMNKDGVIELRSIPAIVEMLSQTIDLTEYGYPALTRVWGFQLTQFQDPPGNRVYTVLQRNGNPEYLPPARRMDEADAWRLLEDYFPGVDRAAVELLIVAKGCSELRAGLLPMVFFCGPTGSGKTQTVDLAASICGDRASGVRYDREPSRMFAAIIQAKRTGSFAFFDEFLKGANAAKIPADTAMEIVLDLKPETQTHILYVGPVALGELPVCVWADTTIPNCVWTHSQIGRRVHVVFLREGRVWGRSAKDLRNLGPEVVKAADSILSAIIDRRFPPGTPTDFVEVAADLGFSLLQDSDIARRKQDRIRDFFEHVCSAPKPKGCRLPGKGWKLIDLAGDSDLTYAWRELMDDNQKTSRAISEMDLKAVLGLTTTAKLETEVSRTKLYVRFASIEGEEKVNGELSTTPVETT